MSAWLVLIVFCSLGEALIHVISIYVFMPMLYLSASSYVNCTFVALLVCFLTWSSFYACPIYICR